METHCSFSIADGTFQQKFSTIKNYASATMQQNTLMDKHTHFTSPDIIIWLLLTQTLKKICPKDVRGHCIRFEKISTLFVAIARYLTFVLQTVLSSHAGRKLSLAAWGGKLEKSPLLNIVYASLFSVHLPEKSEIRAWCCSCFATEFTSKYLPEFLKTACFKGFLINNISSWMQPWAFIAFKQAFHEKYHSFRSNGITILFQILKDYKGKLFIFHGAVLTDINIYQQVQQQISKNRWTRTKICYLLFIKGAETARPLSSSSLRFGQS